MEKGLTQVVILATFPKNAFRDKKFNSKEVNQLADEFLAVRGLKSTTLYDPKVEVSGDKLVLVGLIKSELDQAESVKKSYKKIERFSQKLAEVVSENCRPDSPTQIFMPENLVKDPDRAPGSIPEISDDGSFHYRTDSELEQAMAQEKALKKQDLIIGDKVFESSGKAAKKLFVNQTSFKNQQLKLIYSHHSENHEIFAFPMEPNGTISEKPIKLSFDEMIFKEKTHLKLINHGLFFDKNEIIVMANFTKKFDINKNQKLFSSIKVLEMINPGFDNYDESSPKIWEVS